MSVGKRVRRAAMALLAGVILLLLPAVPAQASLPGCPTAEPRDYAKAARSVFVGTVDSVTVHDNGVKDPDRRVFVFSHQVTISRIYKGGPALFAAAGGTPSDAVTVVTSRTSNRCSLGRLMPGQDYVFFTQSDQGLVLAPYDSGTAPATGILVDGVESVLGDGRDPVPPPPATATFTRVAHGDPSTLTRLLAPGVALIIIGLLGLVVVGRLGRRG